MNNYHNPPLQESQIEEIELKLALTSDPSAITSILSKYLPSIICSNKSEKTMSLIAHVVKRIKANIEIKLPLLELIKLNSKLSNLFINLGFERETVISKISLCPVLLENANSENDFLFLFYGVLIDNVKQLQDLDLFSGLSKTQLGFVLNEILNLYLFSNGGEKFNPINFIQLKVNILNLFICTNSSTLSNSDLFFTFEYLCGLSGSVDLNYRVKGASNDLLKKKGNPIMRQNFNDELLVMKSFQLVFDQKVNSLFKNKLILNLLSKSKFAVSNRMNVFAKKLILSVKTKESFLFFENFIIVRGKDAAVSDLGVFIEYLVETIKNKDLDNLKGNCLRCIVLIIKLEPKFIKQFDLINFVFNEYNESGGEDADLNGFINAVSETAIDSTEIEWIGGLKEYLFANVFDGKLKFYCLKLLSLVFKFDINVLFLCLLSAQEFSRKNNEFVGDYIGSFVVYLSETTNKSFEEEFYLLLFYLCHYVYGKDVSLFNADVTDKCQIITRKMNLVQFGFIVNNKLGTLSLLMFKFLFELMINSNKSDSIRTTESLNDEGIFEEEFAKINKLSNDESLAVLKSEYIIDKDVSFSKKVKSTKLFNEKFIRILLNCVEAEIVREGENGSYQVEFLLVLLNILLFFQESNFASFGQFYDLCEKVLINFSSHRSPGDLELIKRLGIFLGRFPSRSTKLIEMLFKKNDYLSVAHLLTKETITDQYQQFFYDSIVKKNNIDSLILLGLCALTKKKIISVDLNFIETSILLVKKSLKAEEMLNLLLTTLSELMACIDSAVPTLPLQDLFNRLIELFVELNVDYSKFNSTIVDFNIGSVLFSLVQRSDFQISLDSLIGIYTGGLSIKLAKSTYLWYYAILIKLSDSCSANDDFFQKHHSTLAKVLFDFSNKKYDKLVKYLSLKTIGHFYFILKSNEKLLYELRLQLIKEFNSFSAANESLSSDLDLLNVFYCLMGVSLHELNNPNLLFVFINVLTSPYFKHKFSENEAKIIIPKLFRVSFEVSKSFKLINRLFRVISNNFEKDIGSEVIVEKYHDVLLEYLLKDVFSRRTKIRETCCLALQEILVLYLQQKYNIVLDDSILIRIWKSVFKIMDDVDAGVRSRALILLKVMIKMIPKLEEDFVNEELIDFVLTKVLVSGVPDEYKFGVAVLNEIMKSEVKIRDNALIEMIRVLINSLSDNNNTTNNILSYLATACPEQHGMIDHASINLVGESESLKLILQLSNHMGNVGVSLLVRVLCDCLRNGMTASKYGSLLVVNNLIDTAILNKENVTFSENLLKVLSGTLNDPNKALKNEYAFCIGKLLSLLNSVGSKLIHKFVSHLNKLYFSEDLNTQESVSMVCWHVAKVIIIVEDEIFIPLVFFAKFDENETLSTRFTTIWNEIDNGNLYKLKEDKILEYILNLLVNSSSHLARKQIGKCLLHIITYPIVQPNYKLLLEILGKPLFEKINLNQFYDGKQELLASLVDILILNRKSSAEVMMLCVNGLNKFFLKEVDKADFNAPFKKNVFEQFSKYLSFFNETVDYHQLRDIIENNFIRVQVGSEVTPLFWILKGQCLVMLVNGINKTCSEADKNGFLHLCIDELNNSDNNWKVLEGALNAIGKFYEDHNVETFLSNEDVTHKMLDSIMKILDSTKYTSLKHLSCSILKRLVPLINKSKYRQVLADLKQRIGDVVKREIEAKNKLELVDLEKLL